MSDAPLSTETLDAELEPALERLILTLADSKRLMGIRYSDWLLGAPSIEAGIAASSMAQDEWGHARLLYAMLKGLDIDPVPVEHDRPAEEYRSVGPLDEPCPDWPSLIAAMVLVDGAITAALGSFAEGRFEPARSRVPKMIAEEEFHRSLGAAWFHRLAESGGEARALLTGACERALPELLAWVGAADAPARALQEAGVLAAAETCLGAFRDAVRDDLAAVDIDVDAAEPSEAWDEERGRGPGHPDEEAVQRARGDLNRALFVE